MMKSEEFEAISTMWADIFRAHSGNTCKFFLGTHRSNWLADPMFVNIPLFVSRRTLPKRKFHIAVTDWALDSGGFTELNLFGGWKTTAKQYVEDVRRFVDNIGRLIWAAPQDWMCEPHVIQKTGLTVKKHQQLTVRNFLELRSLAPDLPFIPVLQGWSLTDYWRCEDMYESAGVRLKEELTVGVGTICRRQGTSEVATILQTLAGTGLRLHGFGVKSAGLAASAPSLVSADSLAWSFRARRSLPLPGHEEFHKNCANCADYALKWRKRLMLGIEAKHAI